MPLDLMNDKARPHVFQGVEIDQWHRPRAYRVLIGNPGGNSLRFSPVATAGFTTKTKRVPAEQMTHLAWRQRYPQVRGVSLFAPVSRRLLDIHDLDESERIGARTRSRLAMWIKRDPELNQPVQEQDTERHITMPQGAVADDLLPGEDIGHAFADSPSANINEWRQGQLRAVAAGSYTRYSAIARDYNGTYSSQRQELVEAAHAYKPLTASFISRAVRPQYARLIETAILEGRLDVPAEIPLSQLMRAEFVGPAIPWIDPLKETQADVLQINSSLATREQVIRKRSGDPRLVPEKEPKDNEQQPTSDSDQKEDEDEQGQRRLAF